MAIFERSDQLRYTGKGYLDAKMQPVNKISDLNNINVSERFIGLTVTVLYDNEGNLNPCEYWIKTPTLRKWEKKTSQFDGEIALPLNGNDKEIE